MATNARGTSGTSGTPAGIFGAGRAPTRPLTSLDLRETDGIFAGLRAPTPGEVDGRLRGRLFSAIGFQHLPAGARSVLCAIVNGGLGLWWGKEFHGDTGNNVWLDEHGPRLGTYGVRAASAGDGSGPVLHLDYGAATGLHAEVRTLKPGRHLGRLVLTTNARSRRLLYFGLDS